MELDWRIGKTNRWGLRVACCACNFSTRNSKHVTRNCYLSLTLYSIVISSRYYLIIISTRRTSLRMIILLEHHHNNQTDIHLS